MGLLDTVIHPLKATRRLGERHRSEAAVEERALQVRIDESAGTPFDENYYARIIQANPDRDPITLEAGARFILESGQVPTVPPTADTLERLGLQKIETEQQGFLGQAARTPVRFAEQIVESTGAGLEWGFDALKKVFPESAPEIDRYSRSGRQISRWFKDAQQQGAFARDPYTFAGDFWDNPSLTRAAIITLEAIGYSGIALGVTALTKSPTAGVATLGALVGSSQFQEAKIAGASFKEASREGILVGTVEALLERLPLGFFLGSGKRITRRVVNELGEEVFDKAGKAVLEEFVPQGLKYLAKQAGTGVVIETGTEVIQNTWQNLITKTGHDNTRSLAEGLTESIIGGIGAGGGITVVTTKLNQAVQKAQDDGVTNTELDAAFEELGSQIEVLSGTKAPEDAQAESFLNLFKSYLVKGEDDQGTPFGVDNLFALRDSEFIQNLSRTTSVDVVDEINKLILDAHTLTTFRAFSLEAEQRGTAQPAIDIDLDQVGAEQLLEEEPALALPAGQGFELVSGDIVDQISGAIEGGATPQTRVPRARGVGVTPEGVQLIEEVLAGRPEAEIERSLLLNKNGKPFADVGAAKRALNSLLKERNKQAEELGQKPIGLRGTSIIPVDEGYAIAFKDPEMAEALLQPPARLGVGLGPFVPTAQQTPEQAAKAARISQEEGFTRGPTRLPEAEATTETDYVRPIVGPQGFPFKEKIQAQDRLEKEILAREKKVEELDRLAASPARRGKAKNNLAVLQRAEIVGNERDGFTITFPEVAAEPVTPPVAPVIPAEEVAPVEEVTPTIEEEAAPTPEPEKFELVGQTKEEIQIQAEQETVEVQAPTDVVQEGFDFEGETIETKIAEGYESVAVLNTDIPATKTESKKVDAIEHEDLTAFHVGGLNIFRGDLVAGEGPAPITEEGPTPTRTTVGRTKSANPEWFQVLSKPKKRGGTFGMGKDQVLRVIDKALAGEKLAPEQIKVLNFVLNQIEHTDFESRFGKDGGRLLRSPFARQVEETAEERAINEPLANQAVTAHVQPLVEKANSKNAAKTNIVYDENSIEDLEIRKDVKRLMSKGEGGPVLGYYDPQTKGFYLFSKNLRNKREAVGTWLHEQIGHHGFRQLFGDTREYDRMLNNVFRRSSPSTIKRINKTHGLDLTKPAGRQNLAEEIVADVAETVNINKALTPEQKTVWQQIKDFIKDLLASMGLATVITNAQIDSLLEQAVRNTFVDKADFLQETPQGELAGPLSAQGQLSRRGDELPHFEATAEDGLKDWANEFNERHMGSFTSVVSNSPEQQAGLVNRVELDTEDKEAADRVYSSGTMDTWFKARGYLRDGKIDLGKFYQDTGIDLPTDDPKDLNRAAKFIQLPHDLAQNYSEVNELFVSELKREGASEQATIKDGDITKPYYRIKTKQRLPINKALWEGDRLFKNFSNKELTEKFGLSDEQIAGYRAVRRVLDSKLEIILTKTITDVTDLDASQEFEVLAALHEYNDQVRQDPENKKAVADVLNGYKEKLTSIGVEKIQIKPLVEVANWARDKKGYMPHVWNSEWLVRVKEEGGPGVMLEVPTIRGKFLPTKAGQQEAARRAAAQVLMGKLGWDLSKLRQEIAAGNVLVLRSRDMPVELFEGADLNVMATIINAGTDKVLAASEEALTPGEKARLEGFREDIKAVMEEMYLAKGWGKHLIRRQDVSGFSNRTEEVLSEYLMGFNAYQAKAIAAKDFLETMHKIDPTKTPELWRWSKQYVSDMLGPSTGEVRMFKNVVSLFYLAGDLSASALNMTQNWTHGVAMLRGIDQPKGGPTAEREIARAMKDTTAHYLAVKKYNLLAKDVKEGRADPKKLFIESGHGITEDEILFLREAFEKGWLDPVHFGEVTGIRRNKIYTNYLSKMHQLLYITFTGAEALNRMSTSLAAYRRAKRGKATDPGGVAANVTLAAHFAYGKLNRPEIVRRTGAVGNALYTFMTFPMSNIAFLKNRVEDVMAASTKAEKRRALKVIGSNLAYVFAFGGLTGLPFSFLAKWIWKLFTDVDDDPEKYLYEKLPLPIARGITKGIPAVFGNDLSWKVEGTDIFGAPIGFQTAKQIYRRVRYRGIEPIRRGEYWHVAFMGTPDFLMNPYKAFFLEGGSGIEGTPPIAYDPVEKVYKALGFTPTRETEVRQARFIVKSRRQERLDSLNRMAEDLVQARKRKNDRLRKQVFADLRKYNERERKKGKRGLTIKTKDVVQAANRKRKHRGKPFPERVPDYMKPYQKTVGRSFGLIDRKKKGPGLLGLNN